MPFRLRCALGSKARSIGHPPNRGDASSGPSDVGERRLDTHRFRHSIDWTPTVSGEVDGCPRLGIDGCPKRYRHAPQVGGCPEPGGCLKSTPCRERDRSKRSLPNMNWTPTDRREVDGCPTPSDLDTTISASVDRCPMRRECGGCPKTERCRFDGCPKRRPQSIEYLAELPR